MAGRPKFIIDYEQVEKLASIHCTQQEIATFLGCSVDTLQHDEKFSAIYKKGLETGKMSLRRLQWKKAQDGNTTMLIWLGKNLLGQKDKIEYSEDIKQDEAYKKLTTEELKKLAGEQGE